ncbi:leucine-rich repeat-containing protein 27 isoform X1 [Hemicordylus capensis]|uniref:leucine-rich repeat-containing protein 27 isoform X1 n=1 Tax=Hemicordylus capensis TaxID=884348 RepID=UPI002302C4E0|nr:leucine-rich repeat-containing protein 27 isoform X1 [Hemicordylus capensis]XP_053168389.1 leucine-rich repeat-containing protein 27 isoform X1 [Hemicordylus capensis]XP_053168390.1 leucine-rich repeat-containing protein 27 isoform X1 [Hemicordylus capensis]
MEEKWPSKDTGGAGDSDGGGDNSQNAQNKRKCDSASGSATTIHQSLENLVSNSAVSLDLSRRDLQHLTGNIYKFLNLKHLHLEGNALSLIPGDFFQRLPNLVWLDLRYNKIKELPSEIGCHRQLKTLLLERNPIKRLPVQLGNVTSLTALNLRHCPLEFPPLEVIQKGLSAILSFLRKYRNQNLDCSEPVSPEPPSLLEQEAKAIVREYKRKCDRPPDRRKAFSDLWKHLSMIKMPTVEKLNLTDLMKSSLDLSDGWPNEEEMIRFQKLRDEFIQDEREEYLSNKMTTNESMSSLPTTKTKGSFSCKSSKVSSRGKRSIFPAVSSYDFLVQSKRVEDFRLAALKEMKEKQDLIEQRRKDKEVLQKWRRQAKLMRERKGTLYTLSPDKGDAVSQYAPYATDDINDHSTLGDWKDLNKQDERMETALNMDPMTFTDELRAAKYKEVANRIKQHTEMMKERRKKLSGIPQEDMERAKQDFETAEKLEEEVEILKKGLHKEYRFTAFTGELPPSMKHSLPTPKPQNIFSNMTF